VNCYDCTVEGRVEAAVGICINCAAGVCQRHLQMGQKDIETGSMGQASPETTRQFVCTACAQVMVDRSKA
jgi:hypothetical protein